VMWFRIIDCLPSCLGDKHASVHSLVYISDNVHAHARSCHSKSSVPAVGLFEGGSLPRVIWTSSGDA